MPQREINFFHSKFRLNANIVGIIFMLIHSFATSIMYVCQKEARLYLTGADLAFFYKAGVIFLMIPWCIIKEGGLLSVVKTEKLSLHVFRSIISFAATFCFSNAILYVHLMNASAFTYLEQVLVMFIGFFIFKEEINRGSVILVLCGIIGNMLIIIPSIDEFNKEGYIYLTLALLFWAINNIVIKLLGKTEKGSTQLFYNVFLGTIIGFGAISYDGMMSNEIFWDNIWTVTSLIIILSIAHLVHVMAFFYSFKIAPISIVMPFDYSRIFFSAVLGFIFMKEVPSLDNLLGYLILTFGGIYMVYYQSKYKSNGKQADENLKVEKV